MPASFTRKVLYNLHPGFHASSPWEAFLLRNHTPPYISAQAEVVHRRLARAGSGQWRQHLVLCTDGLTDVSGGDDSERAAAGWAGLVREGVHGGADNLALALLRGALGGSDRDRVSRALTLEHAEPWLDDITIVVLSL
jgi:pyruvate dehydrogenase phosphatase